MNREDIERIAREAGLHIATDVNWMPIIGLEYAEKFAALVIANHPPQSYMTWQEGYEAGKQTEREACVQIVENEAMQYAEPVWAFEIVNDIKARGQA